MAHISFMHDTERQRFTGRVQDMTATLQYAEVTPSVLDYQSTFVPPELRRQGVGTKLVLYALEYARTHDFRVIPSCWFVAQVMDGQPHFRHLRNR